MINIKITTDSILVLLNIIFISLTWLLSKEINYVYIHAAIIIVIFIIALAFFGMDGLTAALIITTIISFVVVIVVVKHTKDMPTKQVVENIINVTNNTTANKPLILQ